MKLSRVVPQIIVCEWRVIFSENLLHKTVYPVKDPWCGGRGYCFVIMLGQTSSTLHKLWCLFSLRLNVESLDSTNSSISSHAAEDESKL